MGIIITEINGRIIHNFKMRAVRAVAGAVNNINFAVVYLCRNVPVKPERL